MSKPKAWKDNKHPQASEYMDTHAIYIHSFQDI